MRSHHLIACAAALLLASCVDGSTPLEPMAPERPLHNESGATRAAASGSFAANVDFTTLALTPRGHNCLLEVSGALVFSGTIQGAAVGQTSALVFAPCSEVLSYPPGTFADVFRSELEFTGTINGEAAQAQVLYQGRVQPGGRIEGRFLLSRGASGVLDVDAQAAVGGSYSGTVIVP